MLTTPFIRTTLILTATNVLHNLFYYWLATSIIGLVPPETISPISVAFLSALATIIASVLWIVVQALFPLKINQAFASLVGVGTLLVILNTFLGIYPSGEAMNWEIIGLTLPMHLFTGIVTTLTFNKTLAKN